MQNLFVVVTTTDELKNKLLKICTQENTIFITLKYSLLQKNKKKVNYIYFNKRNKQNIKTI